MTSRYVVIDTNFFASLRRIDNDCELVELLCDVYSGVGKADHGQLKIMDYCPDLMSYLQDHGISDEQVAEFVLNYKGRINLARISLDPVDLRLIVLARNNPESIFLTCETKLLELSDEEKIDHACFKAAIHRLDIDAGGLFNDPTYKTQEMFKVSGEHPFFHYANNRRCNSCDSLSNQCKTKTKPPTQPV